MAPHGLAPHARAPRGSAVRLAWRAGVAAAIATVLAVLVGGQAHADPDPATIEAQIDAQWRAAEPLIEHYDQVHEEYERNLSLQAQLQSKLDPLQQTLSGAEAEIGKVSARAYMGGLPSAFDIILSGAQPGDLADQLTYLNVLARQQSNALSTVVDAKRNFDALKGPIDSIVAQLAQQDADLTAQKADIDNRINELENLRAQAYADTGATGSLRPAACPAQYLPTNGYKAAAFACSQAGKPYVWDAAGPDSYDCSGLVLRAWAQVGVYMPHNAAQQRGVMPYVDASDLQIGDLVFYYSDLSHVAIYEGDGWIMQAPQAGDVVRMTKMNYGAPIHSYGRPG